MLRVNGRFQLREAPCHCFEDSPFPPPPKACFFIPEVRQVGRPQHSHFRNAYSWRPEKSTGVDQLKWSVLIAVKDQCGLW